MKKRHFLHMLFLIFTLSSAPTQANTGSFLKFLGNTIVTLCIVQNQRASSDASWTKTYGGDKQDNGYAITNINNGHFTLAGSTNSYGADYTMPLLHTFNTRGESVWSKVFGKNGDTEASALTVTNNNSLVMTGWSYSHLTGDADILLTQLNNIGDPIWAKTLRGEKDDFSYGIATGKNGEIFITGSTNSYSTEHALLVAKFNSSGGTLWSNILEANITSRGRSVAATNDGGCVVIGDIYHAESNTLLLTKFNATGREEWSRTLGSDDSHGYAVMITSNGHILLTGSTQSNDTSHLLVAQYTLKGDLQWANAIVTGGNTYGYAITGTNDGGFAVAGTFKNVSSERAHPLIAKFNNQGTLLSTQIMRGNDQGEGKSIVATSDGHLLITGYSKSENKDILVAKLGLTPNCSTAISAEEINLSLMPSVEIFPIVTPCNITGSDIVLQVTTLTFDESTICPTNTTSQPIPFPTEGVTSDTDPIVTGIISSRELKADEDFVYKLLISDYFEDPQGKPLTLKATEEGKETLPYWLIFDIESTTFAGNPNGSEIRKYFIKVSATNTIGGSTSQTFSINVVLGYLNITSTVIFSLIFSGFILIMMAWTYKGHQKFKKDKQEGLLSAKNNNLNIELKELPVTKDKYHENSQNKALAVVNINENQYQVIEEEEEEKEESIGNVQDEIMLTH